VIAIPLKHWRRYAALRELRSAFEFLEKHADGSGLAAGRNPIEGDRAYALVLEVELKPAAQCRFETHPQHIDVIYLAEGSESIGYAPVEALGEQVEYNAELDTAFYGTPEEYATLGLEARDGVLVFYPEDGHRPWCLRGTEPRVRKIVVKVKAAAVG
jgi:biofilm protein TabA